MPENTNNVTPDQNLARALKANLPMVRGLAGSLIDPEKLMRLALMVCEKNPFLYQCSLPSICRAVAQSAEINLEIGSALNHAYLVPRKVSGQWVAEFQISAQGFIELAYRSGLVESIDVWPVFRSDEFRFKLGTSPVIEHVPAFVEDGKDALTHVYAVAHLTTGGTKFVVLPKARIETLRLMNPAEKDGKFSPWKDHYVEMAKAKAVRALCKGLPKAKELSRAVDLQPHDSFGGSLNALPSTTRTEQAAAMLGIPVDEPQSLEQGNTAGELPTRRADLTDEQQTLVTALTGEES